MALIDILTEAIAGPTTIRRSRERALERAYSSSADNLSSKTVVQQQSDVSHQLQGSPESRPLPPRRPREGTVRLFRPELHRSQSEQPKTPRIPFQQTEFPPDISAMDLNPDQLKRTYSHSDFWDADQNPLPPLPHMRGISKYRTAINADKRWQIDFAKRKLSGLEDCLVQYVVNPMDGMTNEEWQAIKDTVLRRDSAVSSESAHSDSSHEVKHNSNKLREGYISRGLMSSTTSSSRSSFRENRSRTRKDSLTSLSAELNHKLDFEAHQHDIAYSKIDQGRRPSQQLTSIIEFGQQRQIDLEGRKLARACEFNKSGDPESALASDASDDEDDEWSDLSQTLQNSTSGLTRALRESQRNMGKPVLIRTRTNSDEGGVVNLGNRKSLDRTRTIRASSKSHMPRRHSRSGTQRHQKRLSTNRPQSRDTGLVREASMLTATTVESDQLEKQSFLNQDHAAIQASICTKESESDLDRTLYVYPEAADTTRITASAVKSNTGGRRRNRSGTAIRVSVTRL